jgi:hypothetical protein
VRGQRTLPARRQRFQNTVNPASSGTMPSAARGQARVPPLIPEPSPRSGWRGASCRSRRKSNLHPPLPFKGRGDWVRVKEPCPARRQRFQNTVNPASLGHHPCRPRQPQFHPSSPNPLPGPAGGEPVADPGRKATSIPPLPFKGDGGEGSKNPASPPSTLPEHRKSSILVHHPCRPRQAQVSPLIA